MAKKVFKAELSIKSIEQLKKDLLNYKSGLNRKCELLVTRLATEGISVAQGNTGGFGKYITFSVELNPEQHGCKAVLLATNTGIITSEWRTKDGIKTADVSPILMVEFGSGRNAQNPMKVPGVGRGTFPGKTHAFDKDGWWYMDLNNEWHHSYGITPKMPMYKAMQTMNKRVYSLVKEIFGG